MIQIIKNQIDAELRRTYFQLEFLDGSPAIGAAGLQPQMSINGAAFVNTTNLLSVSNGDRYYVELTQAESDQKEGSIIETRVEDAAIFNASGVTVQISTVSLNDVYDRFDEISPLQHFMEASSSVPEGSVISGTYLLTFIEDGSYWITSPDAVNGLEQILEFNIGTGRVPALVGITGYWKNTGPSGFVDVDIYDHEIADWIQLSDVDTRMNSENSNQDYIYIPQSSQVDPVTGIVQLRLRSDNTGANDRLRLDKVVVDSFASGSAGLTPANIALAVWDYKPGDVHDHDTAAYWLRAASLNLGEVIAVTDAQNFQLGNWEGSANVFRGKVILVHDETTDLYYRGVISSHDALGNIVLADPLLYLPVIGDGYILYNFGFNPSFDSVDVGSIGGAPVTGDVIAGVFQSKITIKDGKDRIVYVGDAPTLELVAPEGWDFTGQKVFFAMALIPGGVKKVDKEATVTGERTAEIKLLAADLDTVATYDAEFRQTDLDGQSNQLTIVRFRLPVRQDI